MSADMSLGEKQELFMRLLPRLVDRAHSMGFEVRGGDLFRDTRVHGDFGSPGGYGRSRSCHKLKLAIDLHLFKNGVWMSATADHLLLGSWWETQHPLCRWGGRFNDGNHYSLGHDGAM